MVNQVSIGLVQIGGEPLAVEENRDLTVGWTTQAFDKGADIVVLP